MEQMTPQILLIEGEEAKAAAVQRILEPAGYEVIWASTLQDIVDFLGQIQRPVVISSLRFVELDVFALMRWLVVHRPEARLIVLCEGAAPPPRPHGALSYASYRWLSRLRALATDAFAGHLTAVSFADLIDVLTLLVLTRSTRRLHVVFDQKQGHLYIQDGYIQHAQTSSGTGIDAFRELLNWTGGGVYELAWEDPPQISLRPGEADALLLGQDEAPPKQNEGLLSLLEDAVERSIAEDPAPELLPLSEPFAPLQQNFISPEEAPSHPNISWVPLDPNQIMEAVGHTSPEESPSEAPPEHSGETNGVGHFLTEPPHEEAQESAPQETEAPQTSNEETNGALGDPSFSATENPSPQDPDASTPGHPTSQGVEASSLETAPETTPETQEAPTEAPPEEVASSQSETENTAAEEGSAPIQEAPIEPPPVEEPASSAEVMQAREASPSESDASTEDQIIWVPPPPIPSVDAPSAKEEEPPSVSPEDVTFEEKRENLRESEAPKAPAPIVAEAPRENQPKNPFAGMSLDSPPYLPSHKKTSAEVRSQQDILAQEVLLEDAPLNALLRPSFPEKTSSPSLRAVSAVKAPPKVALKPDEIVSPDVEEVSLEEGIGALVETAKEEDQPTGEDVWAELSQEMEGTSNTPVFSPSDPSSPFSPPALPFAETRPAEPENKRPGVHTGEFEAPQVPVETRRRLDAVTRPLQEEDVLPIKPQSPPTPSFLEAVPLRSKAPELPKTELELPSVHLSTPPMGTRLPTPSKTPTLGTPAYVLHPPASGGTNPTTNPPEASEASSPYAEARTPPMGVRLGAGAGAPKTPPMGIAVQTLNAKPAQPEPSAPPGARAPVASGSYQSLSRAPTGAYLATQVGEASAYSDYLTPPFGVRVPRPPNPEQTPPAPAGSPLAIAARTALQERAPSPSSTNSIADLGPILQEVAKEVPEFVAAVALETESGYALGGITAKEDLDAESAFAYYAEVLRQMRPALALFGAPMEELLVTSARWYVLLRPLRDEYLLGLVTTRRGNLGICRIVLKRAASQILERLPVSERET